MKRVLIITYYWPPAGGPGVQRWLKFATYFKEFGVEPIVYVPENPHYPLVDNAMLAEVPKNITILKHPIKEPYRLAQLFSKKKTKQMSSGVIPSKKQSPLDKLMLYVRGNYFIPDARVGWVKPSVHYLNEYILKSSEDNDTKIDAVITTGPPHSLHFIGLQLQELLGIKWMADFRDPWTTIHYHKSLQLTKASEKKHKQLEYKILNTADLITVTSPTTKKEFEKITDQQIEVVTNGYEEKEEIYPVLDKKFSLAHVGSLLSERNPIILWEVLSSIASENNEFKKDLEITLAGAVSEDVISSMEIYELTENLNNLGYLPHAEALQLQHNAQLLILIEIDSAETRAIIPGKLFEYMIAQRPIVALGPVGSDIETILKETYSGVFFTYDKKKVLKEHIIDSYKKFKTQNLEIHSKNIEKYSRRALTKKMATLIENL